MRIFYHYEVFYGNNKKKSYDSMVSLKRSEIIWFKGWDGVVRLSYVGVKKEKKKKEIMIINFIQTHLK